jgi:hypothetical protein
MHKNLKSINLTNDQSIIAIRVLDTNVANLDWIQLAKMNINGPQKRKKFNDSMSFLIRKNVNVFQV